VCISNVAEISLDSITQQIGAKGILFFELIIRTKVVDINGKPVEFKYYTDDSMFSLHRESYTVEKAESLGILKGAYKTLETG
jgi:hypothetical protein